MAKGDSKQIKQQQQQSAQGVQDLRSRSQGVFPQFQQQWQNAMNQQFGTGPGSYSDIMNQYQNIMNRPDTVMSPQYKANLDQAIGGYQNFADTGGFSPQDIQDIRARSIAPTRSIYQRGVDELRRQKALTGASNVPAAIARQSRQANAAISDANVNANAAIAQMVQQGKLAGLSGVSDVAGRQQAMQNQIDQQNIARLFGGAEGMRGLFGTSPAMSGMFGNQVLQSLGQQGDVESLATNQAQTGSNIQQQHQPWWRTALSIGGSIAPFLAMSSRESKENIREVSDKRRSKFAKHLKDLPLYTWNYKGDKTRHFGPIAEEFKKKFGIGDGTTLHLADVMGVTLAAAKEMKHA